MKNKNYSNNTPDTASQRGSALFLILIAVVLFAALSYAVAQMMNSGSGSVDQLNEQRAELLAGEVMDYGRTMRQAVQNMRISNGCSDSDISFENPIVAGYTNGTNTECQVFDSDGGGLPWVEASADVNDGSAWIITGNNDVDGVGTASPDLVLILPNINTTVCEQINETFGITNTGNDAAIDFDLFTGSYNANHVIDAAASQKAGCLNYVNSGDNFFFYQVLITR